MPKPESRRSACYKLPFEIKPCPQDCGKECGKSLEKCPVYPKFPPELQKVCKENLHLLQYLHALPLDEIDIPDYYEKVTRSLKGKKDPNLIYKVGDVGYLSMFWPTMKISGTTISR